MTLPVLLDFDSQIYSGDALQKAAYRCIDRITVQLERNGSLLSCRIESNLGVDGYDFAQAVEEFQKNVLDYQLRERIRVETEPLRNLVLGIAFSRTGLQGGE